VGDTIQGVTPE